MSETLQQLSKRYAAFYEVSPGYVVLNDGPVGAPARIQRVQAGFNIDVYGIRPEDNEPAMPPPEDYECAYAELQNIAERVSRHAAESCLLEVIPFRSVAIIDNRNRGKVEALVRITISHERGLDQPAGKAEQFALEELEKQLKALNIVRR